MRDDTTRGNDLTARLPVSAGGYMRDGALAQHGYDDLFDLLDGGAEVYRALNVRAVASQTYVKAGGPDVLVDVFDMGSASDAYGAYHHDIREGPDAGIGRESEVAGSSVFFWKHRYYASVVPLASCSAGRAGALALARAIAGEIADDGEIPEIARWLPTEELVASHIHYFHTSSLLERHVRLDAGNPLLLGEDTEGVLARYRGGTSAWTLMLVRYPSPERAEKARARFAGLSGERDEVVRPGEETWAEFDWRGAVLTAVIGAASRFEAKRCLDAVERQRAERSQ